MQREKRTTLAQKSKECPLPAPCMKLVAFPMQNMEQKLEKQASFIQLPPSLCYNVKNPLPCRIHRYVEIRYLAGKRLTLPSTASSLASGLKRVHMKGNGIHIIPALDFRF